SVLCASVPRRGRISCSTAGTPDRASCQAASAPARPPPTTWTGFMALPFMPARDSVETRRSQPKGKAMLEFTNPGTIGKPFSRYTHVVSAPENCRWVHISGQVGVTRDGSILDGFEAQARQTWANVLH